MSDERGKRRHNIALTAMSDERGEEGSIWFAIWTQEQKERAITACNNRLEDPLQNWVKPHHEECPICFLPLPFGNDGGIVYMTCCGKDICGGCFMQNWDSHGGVLEKAEVCVLCREDGQRFGINAKEEDIAAQHMKLANVGRHKAMFCVAENYFKGRYGVEQDRTEGLKWYVRAIEAGSPDASMRLAWYYLSGDGVEKDSKKALEYYENATELGDGTAFLMIGLFHMENGEIEEAMLSLRKAAVCGLAQKNGNSLFTDLRNGLKHGYITKEEYDFTLSENQTAIYETKSSAREEYAELEEEHGNE